MVFAPLWGWYQEADGSKGLVSIFAPLRGWYHSGQAERTALLVFAPLRGWYTKYITEYRKMKELNA